MSLRNLTITGVPAGTPGADARLERMVAMAKNALGAQFKDSYITSAVVGHYTADAGRARGRSSSTST